MLSNIRKYLLVSGFSWRICKAYLIVKSRGKIDLKINCSVRRRTVARAQGNCLLRVMGFWLTNRFHVAVRLFSNRSQMTSKCRKNKEVAHEPRASVSLLFLPHSDVLCDLLLNRPTATWNLFVLYNDQKRKRPIHIPASNRLTFWGFVLV